VRLELLGPVGLALATAACSAPAIRWEADVPSAIARAKREDRPLYVLSLFGDLTKKC
jgi:hypothetical protein